MDRAKLKQVLSLLLALVRNPDTPASLQAQLGEAVALLMEVLDET